MAPGLRELKKQRTRAAIQQAALDLIVQQGYDATTCEQIAAAAEVSPATFFRYFPAKEDVVLTDDYDPRLAAAVLARPARERPLTALRHALAETVGGLPGAEMDVVRQRTALILSVPSLRARMHEQERAAREALAEAFATRADKDADSLEVRAVAAAGAAAMAAGVEHWARTGGALGDHLVAALAAVGEG
jgi:AcrR family transcriptional regulator